MNFILYLFHVCHNITKFSIVPLIVTVVIVLSFYPAIKIHGMESDNYVIQSDSINIGGVEEASSTTYAMTDTIGESGTGELTGVLYRLLAGYRQMVEVIIGVTCNNDGICDAGETEANCPNDCVVTLPTGGGGAGSVDISAPNIYNLSVFPTTYSVIIKWQTSEKTISNLFWGKTSDYKEGTITKVDYATQHLVLIKNLVSDNSYHFQIEVKDISGNKTLSQDQSFKTMLLPDEIPPSNVSNLKMGEDRDTQIEIFWQNPPDPDFKEVKIIKNNQFYPQDPNDGEVIYQGKAEHFIDKDVLDEDYYYTVFSYDDLGNYSSGAIIKGKPKKALPAPPRPPIIPPITPPLVPPEIEEFKLEDIVFIQDGRKLLIQNGSILADTSKPLKVSIDYNKLPEVLKTIVISLENCDLSSDESLPNNSIGLLESFPQGSSQSESSSNREVTEGSQSSCENPSVFSFLLKVDPKKTEYSATILSPHEAGIYPLAINILDFQRQELKQLSGKLLLRQKLLPTEDQESNIWAIIGRIIVLIGGLGLLFIVGYVGWRIGRRKTEPLFPLSSH